MKNKNVQSINSIGKMSRIFIIVFRVFAIIAIVCLILAEVVVLMIPNDAIKVDATANASILVDRDRIPGKVAKINFEEKDEAFFGGDLKWSVKTAKETDDGTVYSVDASAKELKWGDAKLRLSIIVFHALCFLATLLIVLHFGQKLAEALAKCDSPFEDEVGVKMKKFGKSLIPMAVVMFLFGGLSGLGAAAAALVIMLFAYVFNYGAQLQKESDETL